ncbi:MAG: serine hydroxymethyltransferase [Desulfobacula sp.]|uniref:serine hydroxymethyltransferase n=1 Tax=Desulfobacula sp. TaxID=2593537 RepID=UPI0025B86175|nr:serine hydroxymethyltransferase [Desulfobacula sp.]MCD4720118.1 serine hydroxymethyltransferase [Desulfobacula sp.]
MLYLSKDDPDLTKLVTNEENRLETTLNLIAAENHSPQSILEVMGSVFNTKTIEGYPGKRFYSGCIHVDKVENLAINRGKSLFGAEYINVQPHSGTSANLAVYFSVLKKGDRVLAMSLPHGGHLSHGHQASITSKCFDFSHYKVNLGTEMIDYDQVREMAYFVKPKMIVAGASSYPRLIDYEKMSQIAREVSAFFLVDMAHLAGLVAAKVIPSPVPHCDFVTFTCYKTMMGGRGGVILCKEIFGKKVDKAVFPGCQGTSAVNLIAAKALIFKLAMEEKFVSIQKKTIQNAKIMAGALMEKGYHVISGGTDNHQVLIDLTSKGISGKSAEECLESAGIILNRNVVPQDADNPGKVSGIRLGSGAVSARGMGEPQMHKIIELMDMAMTNPTEKAVIKDVKDSVLKLCRAFPVNRS